MYAYSQLEYEQEIMDRFIEKEMHNVKGQALRKVSSVVAHFSSEIGHILAYSWFESLPEAARIAECLDLSKMDLFALRNDFEGFREEFLREADNACQVEASDCYVSFWN